LTGSIDSETAIRLAMTYGIKLPSYLSSELQDILSNRHEVDTLKKYFTPWAILNRLYASTAATREIILDAVRKAADDNVTYVEFRTSPRGFLGEEQRFSFEEYLQTISDTVWEAERTTGVTVRFILGIARHVFVKIPLEQRNKMFTRIIEMISPIRPKCFVGVDLNGDETAAGAEGFEFFFNVARNHGFRVTVHAGEFGPAENVRYAVDTLRASRIGHGIAASEDSGTLELLAENNCPLEICPTSNSILGLAPKTEDLPLRLLKNSGVPFVICSDNPARCRTSLSEELFKVAKAFDFSIGDIESLVLDSMKRSFADVETKALMINKLSRKLSAKSTRHSETKVA